MTKRKLLEELIAITKLQAVVLERGDVDEFIVLLDKRQELLDRIQALSEIGSVAKEQYEEELIAELRSLDTKNQIEFSRQFEEVKSKLCEIRKMKKWETHYNNPYNISWEEGIFFDKRERR